MTSFFACHLSMAPGVGLESRTIFHFTHVQ